MIDILDMLGLQIDTVVNLNCTLFYMICGGVACIYIYHIYSTIGDYVMKAIDNI